MIKKLLFLFTLTAFLSCKKDKIVNEDGFIKEKDETPFTVEILPNSRQKILVQDRAWEDQMLGYYNVVKVNKKWNLWYTSWGKSINNDLSGYFCYAYTNDEITWDKGNINQSNIIFGDGKYAGILEQYVFYDKDHSRFVLIGAALDKGKTKTFTWTSVDGVKWKDRKLLFDQYYDTQFSVIEKGDKFVIYQRIVIDSKRLMGQSIIDKNLNLIEEPKVIFSDNRNLVYPQIYSNAASTLSDGRVIFFPTYYDPIHDSFISSIAYLKEGIVYSTDLNITEDIFFAQKTSWGIICPGLIPTGEANTYWLFYYGSNYSHYDRLKLEGSKTDYYRIKVKIVAKTNWKS